MFSVPIKKQMSLYSRRDGFLTVAIMVDGSMYGVDGKYEMHALGRSYVGGILREEMKDANKQYHETLRLANLARKSREYLVEDNFRRQATKGTVRVEETKAMYMLFKSFKPKREVKPDTRNKGKKKQVGEAVDATADNYNQMMVAKRQAIAKFGKDNVCPICHEKTQTNKMGSVSEPSPSTINNAFMKVMKDPAPRTLQSVKTDLKNKHKRK